MMIYHMYYVFNYIIKSALKFFVMGLKNYSSSHDLQSFP